MIQINILRISPDEEFLELHVECPLTSVFNLFEVVRYDPVTKTEEDPNDMTVALKQSNVENLRIRVDLLGGPATFYKIKLGTIKSLTGETQTITAYCSNISFVYFYMLDLVMQLGAACITDGDFKTLSRHHITLRAHQEAMRLGKIEDAKYFYDLL
jgi:hypothetical protein